LVRRVVQQQGWRLDRHVDDFGRTLGEELLEPTRLYTQPVLDLIRQPGIDVHALSHVTGGGLAANLGRVLPEGVLATVDRSTWTPPPVFTTIQTLGRVPRTDLERTLNQGVGFLVILPADHADWAVDHMTSTGMPAWVVGDVIDHAPTIDPADLVTGAKGVQGGGVQLLGEHPDA
jgi:phosphoribosylformylglycinamidine cyclo-ligase